jgi:hypothetical protein
MTRVPRLAALLAAAALAAACSDSDDPTIDAAVGAAGGTFSGGPVTVEIPAGALSGDARLTVEPAAAGPALAGGQPATAAWKVTVTGAALAQPMTIAITAEPAPVHPSVGQMMTLDGSAWDRIHASWFRPTDGKILALTTAASGTYRGLNRARNLATGPEVASGFQVMMYETFGNEGFFGPTIRLHEILNDAVTPAAAVELGVQVDLERVPPAIVAVMTGTDTAAKVAALNDVATTRALVKAGAVVGVVGFYDDPASDRMSRAGITCALCHVKVAPNAFDLGGPALTTLPIGPLRQDGVPNERMDAGAILAATPFAQGAGAATVALLQSWGPNRFDVRALPDNPLDDDANNPTDTPPIWNYVDLEAQGYGFGWDGLFEGADALASQAEAVYDLVMHGNGAFGTASGTLPPALAVTPPQALLDRLALAETNQPGNDVTVGKLLDLQAWMRSIAQPEPPAFDAARAEAGFRIFHGRGACATCHTTPDYFGAVVAMPITLVPPSGDLAAGIRVPSLRGVAHSAPYFHDDSAATLPDAVERVTTVVSGVTGGTFSQEDKDALVEFLKSL